ncbi:response regulator transcription factor [Parasphaerochaeta coccoides]|uniref:Two component transcriptional regulator, AraC family n=1 Tax=Parasphaerochaeta coccoides (strain ATCC BAA-1237 / DSM 17374 / SPN1) TaxID=760011 RepID=F4GLM4_PARC1|nr:response regulator [Parasphaerochaeta coccoides]AEC02418.1 two component transcriptional regulator, AraC family [Parasphaerochaeta coccoides DSM 17374]
MYSLIIIDDEKELLEGLAHYFPWESIGFITVGAFSDAKSALAYCRDNPVDVVLTDIRMPFLSGLDLIKELRTHNPTPIFCVMSAYSDFEYAKQAIAFGVKEYLVKPLSFDDLRASFQKIHAHLDGTPVLLPSEYSHDETLPLISQTLAIIEKRLGTCSLQNIAGELNISASYLSRLFKKEVGQNFQEYLLKRKMDMAGKMLSGKVEYRNKEIARTLGYQDTQNFCRTFRRYFKTSPQQYRQENKT